MMNNKLYANYTKKVIPGCNGNPLLEALPKIMSDKEVFRALYRTPKCRSVDLRHSAAERSILAEQVFNFIHPLPEYLQCFRYIERALYYAYSAKNPLSPTTMYYLHYLDYNSTPVYPASGPFVGKGSATSITGISGVGKSKMLETVLCRFPQVIYHKVYKSQKLNLRQLIWVYVECPHDASISAFCLAMFEAIDKVLGTDYLEELLSKRRRIEEYEIKLEKIIRLEFIGLIVIDELSNLKVWKTGGGEKLLNFLLNMMNRSGVPFVFSGNPEYVEMVKKKFRTARRAEAGGLIEMGSISKDMWPIFISALWKLQWCNVTTPLDKELSGELYNLSLGIVDVAIRIFVAAQQLVIGSGDERISVATLRAAQSSACGLTDRAINLMKIADPLIGDAYSDLPTDKEYLARNRIKNSEDYDEFESHENIAVESNTNTTLRIPDINRIQHSELEDSIMKLRSNFDCVVSKYSLYHVREAGEESNVERGLYERKILFDTSAWMKETIGM